MSEQEAKRLLPEFQSKVKKEMKMLGATSKDYAWMPDQVLINGLRTQRTPREVAKALLV